MTALTARQTAGAAAGLRPRRWLAVGAATCAIAWGGNEFTPLLVMYRSSGGFSPLTVDLLLFAYVLGIVPALLIGGPMSDRFGRRPVMLPAPVLAALGSTILALGADSALTLAVGRGVQRNRTRAGDGCGRKLDQGTVQSSVGRR